MSRLENWSVVDRDADNPYLALELRRPALNGQIFDDDRFANGTFITTSSIETIDQRKVLTKSGTVYYLGRVNPDYKRAYPGRDFNGPNPLTLKRR